MHGIGNYLCWATRNNLPEIVALLLQYGADVDHYQSETINKKDRLTFGHYDDQADDMESEEITDNVYDLWTPLMIAIENRYIDIIKILLEALPSLDYTTPDGQSALTLAEQSNDEVKDLINSVKSSKKRKFTD